MAIWGFIPIIGRIADAVAAYFNKKQEVDLEKYKVKGTVDVEAMRQDVAIIQARSELARARANDPADQLGRILVMWSAGFYLGFWFYYLVFGDVLPTWIVWEPKTLPNELQYIPHAIIAYLFITAWKK